MFQSFRTLRLAAVPVLAAAALAACSRDVPTAASPRETVSATDAQQGASGSLNQLSRAVAMALQDQGLRQKLKNDLRASRVTREHKLELGTYLRGNGGILLAKMAARTGMSREQLLGLIGPQRAIEFYFPVDAHRESWTGGDDLLVAAQLSDRDVPVGYRLDGTQVTLSATQAPTTPTLAIVGAEADFTHPLGSEWSDSHDAGGKAIGTLARGGARKMIVDPCSDPATMYDDPSCQTTPTYPTFPAGLYLGNANLNDYKESWPRGDPEIEVFLIGPTFNPANNGEKLSCSGQGASGYKYFDMNGLSYTLPYWQVEGQLFTSAEINLYNSTYAKPFEVQFWEDDQDACNIVTDQRSNLQQLVDNMVAVYQVSAMVINLLQATTINPGAVSAILARLPSTWENNDDFLGHARITSVSGNSATATLMMPGGTNGTVTFQTR